MLFGELKEGAEFLYRGVKYVKSLGTTNVKFQPDNAVQVETDRGFPFKRPLHLNDTLPVDPVPTLPEAA